MAYSTEASVRAASGFHDTVKITSATISAYIDEADSIIDAHIGKVYQLPLPTTPKIIRMLSRHITVGLLYSNEYGEESQNLDKDWEKRLKWAMEQLELIREQKLQLVGDPGDATYPGIELPRASLLQPSFYPTEASSDPSYPDSTAPKTGMNTQY